MTRDELKRRDFFLDVKEFLFISLSLEIKVVNIFFYDEGENCNDWKCHVRR